MELYVIRHPRIKLEQGICYGQTDVMLSDTFTTELEYLQQNVPERVDVIFTSPMQRCSKVAQHFRTTTIIKDPRLLELNFGDWELKKWDDIPVELLNAWAKDIVHFKIPQGESLHELYQRAVQFFKTVIAMPDAKTAAIFTHAGVIRCLITYVRNQPLHTISQVQIDYASISKIVVNDGLMEIEYSNKTMQG